MRLSSVLLVATISILACENALSTSTTSDVANVSKTEVRYLRSLKVTRKENTNEGDEEERGNQFVNAIDDFFNPKTLEQLRLRAIKESNDEFYQNLFSRITERAKRFAGWKSDFVSYDDARRYMELHQRSKAEIDDIIDKYKHFILTGEVL